MRVFENRQSDLITNTVFKGHTKTFGMPHLGSTFLFHHHFWNKIIIQLRTNNLTVGRVVDKDVNSVMYKNVFRYINYNHLVF